MTTRAVSTQEGPLLLTLEEVSRLVSHGHDAAETLANIVRLIQYRFATNVCSVYLLEPDRGELVLGATVGLDPAGVGRVRMRVDEGLTGLVAQTMVPVMVDEATSHPRFKYFPEAGEDPYHSFLGVPLIEAGRVLGVLVVQTVEPRPFSPDEIRMLVTVASQLTPLVGGARFLGQVAAVREGRGEKAVEPADAEPVVLTGISLSPGVGLGRVYVADGFEVGQAQLDAPAGSFETERQRLASAMNEARGEISRLSQHISDLVGVDHGAILQAQLMILQDHTIEIDLVDALKAGRSVEGALDRVLDKYVQIFKQIANPMFRERIFDIKDVFRRILWYLQPATNRSTPGEERVVLVAHEASVLDLLSVEPGQLAAVAVEHGGPQSHAAILARSLGVPMVGQVSGLVERVRGGQPLRVDGAAGTVSIDPAATVEDEAIEEEVESALPSLRERSAAPEGFVLPRLEANVNLLGEVEQAIARGIAGVGLYRTEFLFLARRTLPTEEEQVRLYRKLLTALDGRPASIRTFDLRPDKLAQIVHLGSEGSQPFDWRRVLDSPLLQRLFKDQVRAILRAAVVGPARLLVPHVTQTEVLDLITETLEQSREELAREGLDHRGDLPLGVMIEAAAAIPLMDDWAEKVDFFAIGTNDLVASSLGNDREDSSNPQRSDPLHPGILRLIKMAIDAAHRAGKPISVCGEMAGDPVGAQVLAAFGVDALSVAVHRIHLARRALEEVCPDALDGFAAHLLSLRTAEAIRAAVASRAMA
ncbi:MAG: putative PEP-binding protein [Isosphaeraceae bacterium]